MYKIKQAYEDFYVKELIDINLGNGNYAYFLLKKKNLSTSEALALISNKFNINLKNIGCAGNKDKKALTEQYISILNGKKNLENLNLNNIKLKFIGNGNKRINLGNNLGNYFKTIVRNLDKRYDKTNFIVNYFDEQRFSKNNILIGKYILQGNFDEICKLLEINYNDLSKNKKLLRFYLHSYQSYLFNRAVAEYLRKKVYKKVKYSLGEFIFVRKKSILKFPLISFDTHFKNKDKIYLNILKEEKIKLEQFLIKKLPWLIEETNYRDVFVDVKDFKTLSYEKDELNPGKFKQIIEFKLPKGSYATILVKEMFS